MNITNCCSPWRIFIDTLKKKKNISVPTHGVFPVRQK